MGGLQLYPEKSISEEIQAKWCQGVIFSKKVFLLHIALGHPIKPQKVFERGLGPEKGRKKDFSGLRFFCHRQILWLLRKYVTKIGHYLETENMFILKCASGTFVPEVGMPAIFRILALTFVIICRLRYPLSQENRFW